MIDYSIVKRYKIYYDKLIKIDSTPADINKNIALLESKYADLLNLDILTNHKKQLDIIQNPASMFSYFNIISEIYYLISELHIGFINSNPKKKSFDSNKSGSYILETSQELDKLQILYNVYNKEYEQYIVELIDNYLKTILELIPKKYSQTSLSQSPLSQSPLSQSPLSQSPLSQESKLASKDSIQKLKDYYLEIISLYDTHLYTITLFASITQFLLDKLLEDFDNIGFKKLYNFINETIEIYKTKELANGVPITPLEPTTNPKLLSYGSIPATPYMTLDALLQQLFKKIVKFWNRIIKCIRNRP